SSSVQEQDFRKVLPEDITLHVARMQLSNVEADSTLRIVQEIEVESQKLADVDVDVIIFPATAASSRNGIGYDQELIRRISAGSCIPRPQRRCLKHCVCFQSSEPRSARLGAPLLTKPSQPLLKQTELKSSRRRR